MKIAETTGTVKITHTRAYNLIEKNSLEKGFLNMNIKDR